MPKRTMGAASRAILLGLACVALAAPRAGRAQSEELLQSGFAQFGFFIWPFGGSVDEAVVGDYLPLGYYRTSRSVELWSSWGLGSGFSDVHWYSPDSRDGRIGFHVWWNAFSEIKLEWKVWGSLPLVLAPEWSGIDLLAPTTTLAVAGDPAPTPGWFESDATVSLTAVDLGGSGVSFTDYRVDGGGWQTYAAPFVVGGEGVHEIVYGSVDRTSNVETERSHTLLIDYGAPTFLELGGFEMRPGVRQFALRYDPIRGAWVYTVTGRVSDTLDGPADLGLSVLPGTNVSSYSVLRDVLTGAFAVDLVLADHTRGAAAELTVTDRAGHASSFQALAAPEPSTLALLGLGLGVIALARRAAAR